jgi:hypothetical protein
MTFAPLRQEGPGRPVSRILLYPAIHLQEENLPGSSWRSRAYQSGNPRRFGLLAPVVYLAGPSRDTAGGLLPHPFTHHLCRRACPPSHRLVCSLLHLTWRRACATPPLGLLARAAFPDRGLPDPRESGLCSALLAKLAPPGGAATGRTARTQDLDYTSDPPGSRPFARLRLPRPVRTILVGLRRISTLLIRLQRCCQRGSSATAGSNHAPGVALGPPLGSSTPS